MLAKPYRLIKEEDFKNVYRKGKSFFSDSAILKFAKNKLKNSRFGFVVGNKISKKASSRNEIKRRLREIIRLKLKLIKPGNDCVIIAKSNIKEKNYKEIEKATIKLLKRARLL